MTSTDNSVRCSSGRVNSPEEDFGGKKTNGKFRFILILIKLGDNNNNNKLLLLEEAFRKMLAGEKNSKEGEISPKIGAAATGTQGGGT